MTSRKRTKKPARPAPIQFRPDSEFDNWLHSFAVQEKISAGVAAKYLAVLARHSLDVRHFRPIMEVVDLLGSGGTFERICEHAVRGVDSQNTRRAAAGQGRLSEDERQQVVVQNLEQLKSHLRYGMLSTYDRMAMSDPAVLPEEEERPRVQIQQTNE